MDLDTFSYFFIILGGFGLVWSFRKGIKSKKQISDFEYLGFSAFWGVLVFAVYQWIYRENLDKWVESLKNPYIAGFGLFVFAIILGFSISFIFSFIRSLMTGK